MFIIVRIVVVSPVLPLPFGGTDARWLHVVVSELARRNVDVTCISNTEETDEAVGLARKQAADLGFDLVHAPLALDEHLVRRKLASLRQPFSERLRSASLHTALAKELSLGYDVVHIEHLFNGWVARRLERSVLYVHHLETVDWADLPSPSLREREVRFQMGRATSRILRSTPRVIVATDRIAREARRFRRATLPVVPIGIDPSLYDTVTPIDDPVAGLIGSMHWSPSRRAAERLLDLWPRILEAVPRARLLIGGWNSEKFLRSRFPVPGATLHGPVADPREFFGRVGLLVYPTPRGSGMKVKVLESLAYGVPVVSNAEGLEGLEQSLDHGTRLAETDDEFVMETAALLGEPETRRSLGKAGRALVETMLAPGPTVDRLLDAYARLGLA